jgi:hypothetical protein
MQRKEKRTTQAVKTTFTFIKEKEPRYYTGKRETPTQIGKDQWGSGGCRLDLKLAPDGG